MLFCEPSLFQKAYLMFLIICYILLSKQAIKLLLKTDIFCKHSYKPKTRILIYKCIGFTTKFILAVNQKRLLGSKKLFSSTNQKFQFKPNRPPHANTSKLKLIDSF